MRCQACLALRNLASDADTQVLIVKLDGLPCLHQLIQSARGETLTAALACLRNLSIHKQNEVCTEVSLLDHSMNVEFSIFQLKNYENCFETRV